MALTIVLLFTQLPAVSLALPQAGLAAPEPMTFSARTPAAGATVGMSNPDVSVRALDTASNNIVEATATIDGARATVSLTGTGTPAAEASFSTYDLTTGPHTASVSFVADNGGIATDTWTFTIAPLGTRTLTYTASAGGSIVGSSTQTVRYGTSATELEGFENAAEWTVSQGGPGAQSTDTVNVLHGPASLKLTSALNSPVVSRKNGPLYLSSAPPFRLYFYLDQDPKVTRPDIVVTFGNPFTRMTAGIPRDRLQQGWNCVSLAKGDFTAFYGATWADPFDYVRFGVSSATTCSVSFDSLNKSTIGMPMVAINFDDAAQSAYENGYPYMAGKGIVGTMYALPKPIGQDPVYMTVPELQTMQAGGWDIANHTWDHTRLTTLTQPQVQAELTDARDWLVSNGLPRAAADVAYPYGAWDATTLSAMASTGMRSGRTTEPGENVLPILEPYRLKSFAPTTTAAAAAVVDGAIAHESLSVLLFHGIAATTDSYNIALSEFQQIIDYIAAQPVAVVRMSDVVDRHSNDGLSVTAVPNAHYHFVNWSDGVATASRSDKNVDADIAATATFAIDTYPVAASSLGSGTVTPLGVTQVPWDGSQTYAITPDPHHHVVDVVVDGVSQGPITSYTFSNVAGPHTIAATFAIDTYPVAASSLGSGTVTPLGVTQVPWDGSQTYAITPDPHHHVVDVVVDGVSQGPITSYTFSNVAGPHTIGATFAIDTYSIVPSANAHGAISPTGSQIVDWGGSRTFAVNPESLYHISDVRKDGVSIGTSSTVTFANVTANHTLNAVFAPDTPVYRFRNLKNGSSYLWTADPAERASIKASARATWAEEGVAYYLDPNTNTVPLYRFRNLRGGYYLYTADAAERDKIVATLKSTWVLEGTAYFVSARAGAPVFRFRNLKTGTYLLSVDPAERATINTKLRATWAEEGIAYYIAP